MIRRRLSIYSVCLLAALAVGGMTSRAGAFQGHETHEAAAPSEHGGGHGEEGGKGPAILTGDLGNVFWTATIFIVLLIVLRATAWKPILTALQKREEFISSSLADAKKDRDEAKRLMADYAKKIEKAQVDASAIIDSGRRDAENLRQKLHEETNKEVQDMLARAQRDIKTAQETAISEIYSRTLDLATAVAGKIVKRQLSPTDHRALLDESIAEIGKSDN
ncbi:MAG TPA: F0F1 ATP synthase subunit B [Phycisphaerae bacterium]|nr:F0F1 ATP synthase subunit B [Phycisphaerae bacterium]